MNEKIDIRRFKRASKTAEFAALFRTLEYTFPKERRLVEDPFAFHFLSRPLKFIAALARVPVAGWWILGLIDHVEPGARASGVARTRLIDDHLTYALSRGISQVVILGSGYDSRPYRVPECRKTRVFEVDQAGILHLKRTKLDRLLHRFPGNVSFVKTDLNIEKINETLRQHGFNKNKPAFFIWEGVTQYLTRRAVDQTMDFISGTAPGSFLLFTYVHKKAIDQWLNGPKANWIRRWVKQMGEPWIFGFDPKELPDYLNRYGLELVEDVDSKTFRQRYMNPRSPHIEEYRFYRAALARVKSEEQPRIRFFRSFFRQME